MSVTVRPVQSGDHADWDSLFRRYIDFYLAKVPDATIALTWQRVINPNDGDMHGLIALDDASVAVGIATLVFHRSTWSPNCYCYLEDLYVGENARGKGVGRALITATYAEADRRGANRTYWATQSGNATARRLYDDVAELTEFVQYRRKGEV